MRRILVTTLVVLAVALGACGARTELRGGSIDAGPVLVAGVVDHNCGPADEPALVFSLGTPAPTCQVPGIGSGAIVILWKPLPTAAGTFAVGGGSGSYAYLWCVGQTACDAPTPASGTLVLTDLSSTASGSFTLTTGDGTTLSGSFEAIPVCNDAPKCD